jgi:integrase
MATIFPRKNKDRSISFLTLVRVKGFKPTSRCFATKAEAKAWAAPLERDLKDQAKKRGARPTLTTLTVGQLIDKYLDDPNAEAKKSYEDYATRAHWWRQHYGTIKVLDFDIAVLEEARDKLRFSGRRGGVREAGTVNRHLSVMRLIWNWGRRRKWVTESQAWPTMLHLKEPPGRTRFLSSDELGAVLKAAEPDAVMRAAILVSIATGLRQGELLRLKWSDIDFVNQHVTVHEAKNKTPRRVHLGAQAIAALDGLKRAVVRSPAHVFLDGGGAPLTQSRLEHRWKRIRAAAKLADFRWHDLRHTCASYLAQNGAGLLEIADVLGHKTMQMVKRYSHFVQGAPVKGHAELDVLLRGK